MNIKFPNDEPLVYTRNTTVGFNAIVDDTLHQCEISEEVLQDHFDAPSNNPTDLFAAFSRGRQKIEPVARRKIEQQGPNERILITIHDF